ncbi:YebC/PmpR family DNA-binding transcriptional regulator [Desulfomonile tiedjei]|uniref:Probable transcriptional regulatory protein Desti_1416 n=1 Tax=Desulfomonile tiedjei (strain ATCC 49306 / DSM 6799 / DCB-1) TaxID=706587 RepID=I4C3I7_DESTA|nr:YebC/PmpR family DNA-binding transcriptional regulator [Desulfomonile tiedjei]AFM24128.1 DNA-binding regulatory protein, YebC/PmpR family [Desulfomonile tiedjei DSM 6799]
MSGHNKWSTIKHKKGAADAKRGKMFSKLIKEITIAARMGGGDPEGNPRLRTAVLAARGANMPKDNVERAIKRGTGEIEGANYEEINYEGYGPGGVAVLLEALTDNKNRTVAEIRHIFDKYNGNLGESGCVAWMFDKKGIIEVGAQGLSEDEVMELALEHGAQDVKQDGDVFEISSDPGDFETVRKAVEEKGWKIELAEITMIPQNTIKLEGKKAEQMLKMMDALDDHDDLQRVFANFDISEEDMLKASA